MYDFRISKNLRRILKKLFKKDKKLYEQIFRKIEEVISCYKIENYKNLRYNMKDYQRVHISHFVLVFSYNPKQDMIIFEDFDHHDKIYGR